MLTKVAAAATRWIPSSDIASDLGDPHRRSLRDAQWPAAPVKKRALSHGQRTPLQMQNSLGRMQV
jgi:hypothetical protein